VLVWGDVPPTSRRTAFGKAKDRASDANGRQMPSGPGIAVPRFYELRDNLGRRCRIRMRSSSATAVEGLTGRTEDRILTPWMPASA
jgi:hypothetical protein